jgi:thymidylate kinase
MAASLMRWLARMEHGLYAQIPPPDVVLKLSVSVETAKIRNRERIKAGKESDAYLESRHRQMRAWNRPGSRAIYEIDTEQPLESTLGCVRELIWEAL